MSSRKRVVAVERLEPEEDRSRREHTHSRRAGPACSRDSRSALHASPILRSRYGFCRGSRASPRNFADERDQPVAGRTGFSRGLERRPVVSSVFGPCHRRARCDQAWRCGALCISRSGASRRPCIGRRPEPSCVFRSLAAARRSNLLQSRIFEKHFHPVFSHLASRTTDRRENCLLV